MRRAGNTLGRLNGAAKACATFVLCATAPMALHAQTYTTLYSFHSAASPDAALVEGTNGDFYGTTKSGGVNGQGTAFRVTPSGASTTLYSFCSKSGCTDGRTPEAGLVQAANGDFYGTTSSGGANCAPRGCGTVFKITPSGKLTTLYSFCAQSGCTDGQTPNALVRASNGDFYGTTSGGGDNRCFLIGCGTVFKITPSGTLTTLYAFCAQNAYCPDGSDPVTALAPAGKGDFYGTTYAGGANLYGTVFKITGSGTLTTLYSFCAKSGCTDGQYPNGLIQAGNSEFYGTTYGGGAHLYGTVFNMSAAGTLTTIYSFCAQIGCTDGELPNGLIQGADGNLYGTTCCGGAHNNGGTVFKITPTGTLATLYSFCAQSGCADGGDPIAGLLQATNGDFYGTTNGGGADGYGTIFSLSVEPRPFTKARFRPEEW